MNQQKIKQFIDHKISQDGMVETGIKGVKLFRVSHQMRCAPVVYEPVIVAILSGAKEAILDGKRMIYDSNRYLCCSMSMPVEAGIPMASPENPLLGVYISLDTKVMKELVIEMDTTLDVMHKPINSILPTGFELSSWDDGFTEALSRLLQLTDDQAGISVLGDGRLRELYYAVLKGEVGLSIRHALSLSNEIAKVIEYLSVSLDKTISIDDIALRAGMSRAALHRKFKQATAMSPIQFIKSMRLNAAAMKIACGTHVGVAAADVGYVSSSQFSREFKRMYGQSPKQWVASKVLPNGIML